MKKKIYNVLYSNDFNKEFGEILDYITNKLNKPHIARKLINELEEKIKLVTLFPNLFTPDIYNGILLYKFNIQNYSVFYLIEDKNILVCHIFYSKRDFPRIIK